MREIIIFVYKKSIFFVMIGIIKRDLFSTSVRNAYFHQGKKSMVNTFLGDIPNEIFTF